MTPLSTQPPLQIGAHRIAPDSPAFIIAEAGINHNGSIERAKQLVDIAKQAGASAIKFQKRDLASIYRKDVLEQLQNFEQGFQYLIPILKDFELSPEAMWEVKRYCDEQEIVFICTPFDIPSAELLYEMQVPAYKVSSADLTNFLLLEKLVSFKKPLILSTGMSTDDEVRKTVAFLQELKADFALLHCVSSYPVDPQDAKLRRISQLQEEFSCPVGYSGHDMGTALSIAARTLGAAIIEKHITTDRRLRGPDHKLSLLPEELESLVESIRAVEAALEPPKEHLLPAETLNQLVFRKSLAAAVPIAKGQIVTREMIAVKSPGLGLSVQELENLLGREMNRDIKPDELFLPGDIDSTNGFHPNYETTWGLWGLVVRYHDFEQALPYKPTNLEFHLTYNDTLLPVPHEALECHKETLKQMKLRVHCCEYIEEKLFDLCSSSPEILSASAKTLQRVIDITAELSRHFSDEQPKIIFNCGAMTLKHFRRREIDVERFIETIKSLDLKNTHLLAQNMPPNPWYFGGQWKGHYFTKADELIHFCQETGQSLCLDLSHAYMACKGGGYDMGEYIEKLKPYVQHIHLSDARSSEGEGLQIGEGEVDFADFFRRYRDYRGTWVPEIWLGHRDGNCGALKALEKLSILHEEICFAEQADRKNLQSGLSGTASR